MRVAGLAAALLAVACAGRQPPDARPLPSPPPPPPLPEPAIEGQLPPLAPPLDAERCAEVAELAAASAHKPAVDLFDLVRGEGRACDEPVSAAASSSRRVLEAADERVRSALALREAGDLAGALRELDGALALYPLYYWARRLREETETRRLESAGELQERLARARAEGGAERALELLESEAPGGLGRELEEVRESLRQEAAMTALGRSRMAAEQGHAEAAARLLEEALARAPADYGLRLELVERARLLGLELYAEGRLALARALWVGALALAPDSERLGRYVEQVDERLRALARIRDGGGR